MFAGWKLTHWRKRLTKISQGRTNTSSACKRLFRSGCTVAPSLSISVCGWHNNCRMRIVVFVHKRINKEKAVNESEISVNQLTHNGDRHFKCEQCRMAFSENCRLERHKQTHTGKKPFKCELCDKAFVSSSLLSRHKRIHTGERPYKCEHCDTRFCERSYSQRHQRMQHKVSMWYDEVISVYVLSAFLSQLVE